VCRKKDRQRFSAAGTQPANLPCAHGDCFGEADIVGMKKFFPHIQRFLREYLPGHGKLYFWGLLFLLLTVWITTTIPRLINTAVTVLESASAEGLAEGAGDELANAATLIIVFGVLLVLFRTLSRVLIFIPGRRVEASVRQDYYDATVALPADALAAHQTGDLVSRGTNDITSVRVLLSMGALHSINSIMMIAFCLYHMNRISGRLTLVCLLMVPLIVILMRLLSRLMWERIKLVQQQLGVLTDTIREQLCAHTLLTIYPVFGSLFGRFQAHNDVYSKRQESAQSVRVLLFNLSLTMAGIAMFILMIVGGPQVVRGEFGIAEFVEFSVYLGLIQDPLRAWGWLISITQRGEICLKRIYEIRDLASASRAAESAKAVTDASELDTALDPTQPLLEVRDMHFRHARSAEAGFSLEIPQLQLQPRKKYGVFGTVGSGKSTLLNLLTGNLPAPPGSVFLHGVDVATIDRELLMRQFTIAAQENRHFNQSLSENIQLVGDNPMFADGWPGTACDFDTALEVSQLAGDIAGFSDGMDTVIGEHGMRLSGGQKQRLAVLRALLKPRRMLLLDDIVSAVDHDTETRLLAALFTALADETVMIISHRVSALIPCDEILVLDDGKIVAQGSHEALMASHEGYRTTCEHQALEQQVEAYAHDL
jgi:ATP-binding cassette subfamily B multidrug efflux pump